MNYNCWKYGNIVLFLTMFCNQVVLGIPHVPFYQDSIPADDETDSINQFKLLFQVGNNIQQFGKKMAKDEYYLRSGIQYLNKGGLYTGLSCDYMPGDKKKPIDNFMLNLGYDYDIGERFSVGIDYTYTHYYSTKEVASEAPHAFVLYSSRAGRVITPGFSAIYNVGKTANDFITNLDFTHIFMFHHVFKTQDQLSFPVMIGGYAGTSNIYKNYVLINKIKTKSGQDVNIQNIKSGFAFTNVYISVSCKYRVKNFSIGGSFEYDFFFNLPKKLSSSNIPVYDIHTIFYF